MQDVKKIEIDNNKNRKRQRRRQKNMTGYYILVAFLALGIGVSLSVTFLFNIKDFIVVGNSQYDTVDIIKASEISKGDNLIRLNTSSARDKILSEMLYIDDVVIKKKFPDKLELEIYPSKEMACVQYKEGYIIISEKWRILENIENPDQKKLLRINGFDPKSGEPKSTMKSNDDDKEEILKNILGCISSLEITDITSIDIDDKYDIRLNYSGRINMLIGNSKDIEYKLKYGYYILTNELRENKSGYLIYHDTTGYSYISEDEYNQINNNLQKNDNTEDIQTDNTPTTDIVTDISENIPVDMVVTDIEPVTDVPEEDQITSVVSETEAEETQTE